ncbi:MAG: flavodoxin domain-containing protein [Saprospiraceae bacterium]
MLPEVKMRALNDLVQKSSKEELIWINGYLSALVMSGLSKEGSNVNIIPKKFTILYGTDTGNSKKLAIEFSALGKKESAKVKVAAMDTYKVDDLVNENNLCIIMSTHGDGDPPPTAKKFFDQLMAKELTLSKLEFSILALGDSSYPYFCKAGEDVHHRLTALGGKAILPIQKCDVDYEADATYWFKNYLKSFKTESANEVEGAIKKVGSSKKIYTGTIKSNINLNGRGSNKRTHHIEIKTTEPVIYESGDALGILPKNKKPVLEEIFEIVKIDPNLSIPYKGESHTLIRLLTNKLNINYLKESQIQKYSTLCDQKIPNVKMDLYDLVRIYPIKPLEFVEFISYLNDMTPRLYSVCSSPNARENEVHILVGKNAFRVDEDKRYGLCSDMLCDLDENGILEFYIHKNKSFRLPSEDTNIILIGPGTGMAPMRSFIEERDNTGATGKNWLFFGEQHFISDFFYQTEIQQYAATGLLNKVDLAWSRENSKKTYVQHKMLEHSQEFYDWIKNGAHIFVSGTRSPMSEDVEKAIVEIIYKHSGKSAPESEEYWNELKESGIYKADVY